VIYPTHTARNIIILARAIVRIASICGAVGIIGDPVSTVRAQNLETIADEKPVSLAGALSASASLYQANGIEERHTPFTWLLEGSPVLSLYGIQIPFNITISEQQRDFRQPFNQFGLSPQYKSIVAHLGYRNMMFSRYSLNGHTFLGAGFELKSGQFRTSDGADGPPIRLQAMYGRLQRAVEEDTSRFDIEPAYHRLGYAAKIGIGDHRDHFDLNLMYAQDDSNSLRTVPLRYNVLPAENLVFGINTRLEIIEELALEAEGAASLFTRDIRSPRLDESDIPQAAHNIFDIRESTSLTTAMQAALAFRIPTFQARLQFERIEPDYKSLGTYYILSDIERWTFAPTLLLLQNKLRLSASVGLEHDNLLNNRQRTTNRLIGSGGVGYSPSQKFGVDLNFTNYSTDQKVALTRAELLDTLPNGQPRLSSNVARSVSIAPRLTFLDEGLNQIVTFVAAYQEYQDRTQGIAGLANSQALTGSINYIRSYAQLGRTIGASLIFSAAEAGIATTRVLGGSVNGSMSMLEERALVISASLGATSSSVSTLNSSILSFTQTLNGSYKLTDKNILTLSLYATENGGYTNSLGVDVSGYSEITTTLSFTHVFDL
jgi:hypothetical protein